jgi:hypothetical protein
LDKRWVVWCWIGVGVLGIVDTVVSLAVGNFTTRGYMGPVFIAASLDMIGIVGRVKPRTSLLLCCAGFVVCVWVLVLIAQSGQFNLAHAAGIAGTVLFTIVGIAGICSSLLQLRRA